jgi:cell division protein FtsW
VSRESRNLVVIVTALLALGLVLLFSSSSVYAGLSERMGDSLFFVKRQVVWILLAGVAAYGAARVKTDFWRKAALPLLLLSYLLLGAVFLPVIGTDHNTGARRWLNLGPFSFQPSEMTKVALAVFLAWFLARDPDRIKRFFRGFLPAILAVGAAAALVIVEPDFGTALLICGVMSLVLFVAGAKPVHFAPFLLIGGMGVACIVATYPHVQKRIDDWRIVAWQGKWDDSSVDGYQMKQSLLALGSGGLVSDGLGRGTQKFGYLPEAHTDFILAVTGEELGFLGAAGVVMLYLCLGITGWQIMRKCREPFAFHLSFGLTAFILLQAAINVAVVTAAVPTKGIPLPLVSYGGTSLLFTMASVGILYRVSESSGETERGECASFSRAAVRGDTSSPE